MRTKIPVFPPVAVLIGALLLSAGSEANTATNDNNASQLEQTYSGLTPNLGVLGVTGNVGNGPTSGGYSSTTGYSSTATMNCSNGGPVASAPQTIDGSYTLRCSSSGSGGSSSLEIQICPNDGNGAACSTLSGVSPGSTQNLTIENSPVTIAVTSCALNSSMQVACPTSVTTSQTVAGSNGNLADAAENLSGSNSAAFAMTNAYGVYDQNGNQLIAPSGGSGTGLGASMATGGVAQTATSCYQGQNANIGTGSITNCSGTQTVNFGLATSTSPSTCSGTGCVSFTTAGEDSQATLPPSNGLQKAMQAEGVLDAIKKNIDGNLPPTLFAGTYSYCTDEFGCGSDGFACCCDTGITTSSGLFKNCNTGEATLAGARRSNLTHQLEYCCGSRILGACVANVGSFCVFPSMLGRIIQEQGRQQLAAYAAAGAGSLSNSSVIEFGYYSTSSSGSWYGPVIANGNSVWAWQWPIGCSGSGTTAALGCAQQPGEVWWAACDGSACATPANIPPAAATDDTLYELWTDGTNPESRYLSKYVMTSGTCATSAGVIGTCSYTLSAITAGTALLEADLGWPLYSTQAGWSASNTLGSNYNFEEYSSLYTAAPAMGGSAPTSVLIQYQTVGADNTTGPWNATTLPLAIPATSPISLSGGATVWGYCDPPTYQCIYHLAEPGTAVAKPWDAGSCGSDGQSTKPDCTGFSMTQFMLIDISKMDLSQWYAQVNSQFAAPSASQQTAMQAQASSQAAQQQAAASPDAAPTGASFDNSASGTTVMQVTSAGVVASTCQVGTTACDFTLTLTSNWPNTSPNADYNTAPVKSVTINWGDGSANTTLARGNITTVNSLPMFQTNHTYGATGNFPITATFTMVQPSSGTPSQSVPVEGLSTLGGNCCSPAGAAGYQYPDLIMGNDSPKYLSPDSCTLYHWDINFTLSAQDISNLYRFLLTQVHYDDWVAIRVNGTVVYGGSFSGTTQVVQSGNNIIYDTKGDQGGCDQGTNWIASPNVNMIPYLVAGSNDIHIDYAVAGKGHYYAVIDAEDQPYCNSTASSSCTSTSFNTHVAKSQVQVWQDTPPVDQSGQEANGGVSTIPP